MPVKRNIQECFGSFLDFLKLRLGQIELVFQHLKENYVLNEDTRYCELSVYLIVFFVFFPDSLNMAKIVFAAFEF